MPIRLTTSRYGQSGSPTNQYDVHDPKPMYMIGNFTFRAYRYLHLELNEAYNAGTMNYIEYHGYIYSSGIVFGNAGYYPYGPSNGPIAIYKNYFGAGGISSGGALNNIGVTSNNKIWYRFDRGSTGYTEGGLVIFASENDPPNFRRHSVTQRTLNNNSSCPF